MRRLVVTKSFKKIENLVLQLNIIDTFKIDFRTSQEEMRSKFSKSISILKSIGLTFKIKIS